MSDGRVARRLRAVATWFAWRNPLLHALIAAFGLHLPTDFLLGERQRQPHRLRRHVHCRAGRLGSASATFRPHALFRVPLGIGVSLDRDGRRLVEILAPVAPERCYFDYHSGSRAPSRSMTVTWQSTCTRRRTGARSGNCSTASSVVGSSPGSRRPPGQSHGSPTRRLRERRAPGSNADRRPSGLARLHVLEAEAALDAEVAARDVVVVRARHLDDLVVLHVQLERCSRRRSTGRSSR